MRIIISCAVIICTALSAVFLTISVLSSQPAGCTTWYDGTTYHLPGTGKNLSFPAAQLLCWNGILYVEAR